MSEPLPNHDDGRSQKRVQYSHTDWGVQVGLPRDVIVRKAAVLMQEQWLTQWKRWRFVDEHCERIVGTEQERSNCEEAERRAVEELRVIRAKLERVGKRRVRAASSYGGGRPVRDESESGSKFE